MTGTILIVETAATRRIALRATLGAAFRRVLVASGAAEALAVARAEPPEILLAASDLPDTAASALRLRLAAQAPGTPPPALAVLTPAGNRAARIDALEAGADDAIACGTQSALLLARLRRLLRDREDTAELRLREATRRALGFAEPPAAFERPARAGLLASDRVTATRLADTLAASLGIHVEPLDRRGALALGPEDRLDALVLTDASGSASVAGLVPALRAQGATRTAALLVHAAGAEAEREAAQALDLGAQDALAGPFDAGELALRLQARLAAKRRADRLRDDLREGLAAAVTDPLTGLYNRRYALPQLARLAARAASAGEPLTVMVADLDHFKAVNDAYGHAAGDTVLAETATRLRGALREGDIAARIGGEEFLVVLPATDAELANAVARRLCGRIAHTPVALPGSGEEVRVTVSIGLATLEGDAPGQDAGASLADGLLQRADRALYGAKSHGRNRVRAHRSAA